MVEAILTPTREPSLLSFSSSTGAGTSPFSLIVSDNETATAQALTRGDFVQAYLLVHALLEALLRIFLRMPADEDINFNGLIYKYRQHLETADYPFPTFIDELTQFNRRRNRIVHQLWRKGSSFTNRETESAALAAVVMYGLFIEWLETFDFEITRIGFQYDEGV